MTEFTASFANSNNSSGSLSLRSSKNIPPKPLVSLRWEIVKYLSALALKVG